MEHTFQQCNRIENRTAKDTGTRYSNGYIAWAKVALD
jgi:hypothetical protein